MTGKLGKQKQIIAGMPVLWTLHKESYLGNFHAPQEPSQAPWKAQLKREAFTATSEYAKYFLLITCMQASPFMALIFGAMHMTWRSNIKDER